MRRHDGFTHNDELWRIEAVSTTAHSMLTMEDMYNAIDWVKGSYFTHKHTIVLYTQTKHYAGHKIVESFGDTESAIESVRIHRSVLATWVVIGRIL